MGTGVIYDGQMPLEKWKEKYYFDKGVWKELPKKPTPSKCRYIYEDEDHELNKTELFWHNLRNIILIIIVMGAGASFVFSIALILFNIFKGS